LKTARQPVAAILFVALCAGFNGAGWLLSLVHQVNVAGYAAVSGLFILLAGWWWRQSGGMDFNRCMHAGRRRFRRGLPAVFGLFVGLVFLGGFLYAPANYDAVTYRLPRMLHWWSAESWQWIPGTHVRMNYSGVGWEWTAMPLLVLTHSDRLLFLIDALGFLLMPGLVFSILRNLGVARKVAWAWMWLLPLAYGYITQAGSVGNDLTGTVFLLLSVFFGLRARKTRQLSDVWLALLAAGMMTAVKMSSLPLVLPCLMAVGPAWRTLLKGWLPSLGWAVVALLASAAPLMVLNQINTGGWNGDPKNQYQMQMHNTRAALIGNSMCLAQQILMPPVLPGTAKLNDWVDDHIPASIQRLLHDEFPRYTGTKFNEFPIEEGAGLGLGITVLLLIPLLATGFTPRGFLPGFKSLVAWAAWAAALVYMCKMGSEATARLMLPYYPLLCVPFLLLPAQQRLLRHRWWRGLLVLVALSALPAMVLSATRPLWPGKAVAAKVLAAHPNSPRWQRMFNVYDTYSKRNDLLAPLREQLPADVREVGVIIRENDAEYSLWRPFGHRKVIEIDGDVLSRISRPDRLEWVVVNETEWTQHSPTPLPEWVASHGGSVVKTASITSFVSDGPGIWYLVHFPKN